MGALDYLKNEAGSDAWRANDPDRAARAAWAEVKRKQEVVRKAERELEVANTLLAHAERTYLDIVDGAS